jgi:hypothetical protein
MPDATDQPAPVAPEAPPPPAPRRRRRRWPWVVVGLLMLPALLFAAWTALTLWYTYSDGERSGFLQKVSRKGWVCKTWEGELQLVAIPGAAPEMFHFTVREDSVAKQLERLMGQRVTVYYEQHRGIPTDCFGDTEYFVTRARATQ